MKPVYINPKDLKNRSDVVIWNGVAYLAGAMPSDGSASLADQTRDVLQKIDAMLAAAGTSKEMLLTATIWMTDVKQDAAGFTAIWNEWLVPGCRPVRACVESAFHAPGLLEVMITAAVPDKQA